MYIYVPCTPLLLVMYKQSIIVYWHASELGSFHSFFQTTWQRFLAVLYVNRRTGTACILFLFTCHDTYQTSREREREEQNKKPPRSPSDLYATANFLFLLPFHFPQPAPKKKKTSIKNTMYI